MTAPPDNDTIGSLVLAAGFSRRMGLPKALLQLPDGSTFLEGILKQHRRAGLACVVVVGDEGERIQELTSRDVRWVHNPRPEDGPLSSLLLGLEKLRHCRALIVQAVDHPLVDASTLGALIRTHRRLPACILIPEFRGAKGHPVLFPSRYYPDLRAAPLRVGARAVVRANLASVHRVPVNDPAITVNINTPKAYQRHFGRSPRIATGCRLPAAGRRKAPDQ